VPRSSCAKRFCLIHDLEARSPSLAVPGSGAGPHGTTPATAQENPGCKGREDAVITAEDPGGVPPAPWLLGSPRVHQELAAARRQVGRQRVARLMRSCQLQAKTRKAFRPAAKASSSVLRGQTENLLAQDFQPRPNRSWAGDITYIRPRRLAVPGRLDRSVQCGSSDGNSTADSIPLW